MLILLIIMAGGYLELAQIAFIDFMIPTQLDVQNDFALTAALNEVKSSASFVNVVQHRASIAGLFTVFFLFEDTSGNGLLTPETLQQMCIAENEVIATDDFLLYCITQENLGLDTNCNALSTSRALTTAFYDTRECIVLGEEEFNEKKTAFLASPLAAQALDSIINPTVARSTILLGGPLGKDSPPGIDFDEVEELFIEPQAADGYSTIMDTIKFGIFDTFGITDNIFSQGFRNKKFERSGVDIRIHGFHLEFIEFQTVVQVDSLISGGSFAVVTTLVYLYTRSCFFSFIAMIAVAMSVFVGLFLYAVVFQIDYFNNLHIVVLFIILAIGANNIFVLVDAWRQSEAAITEEIEVERLKGERNDEVKSEKKELSRIEIGVTSNGEQEKIEYDADDYEVPEDEILRRRLTYAYKRSSLSVANTAMTTFLAFVATSVSDLAPIAAFGVFAGLVIFVNLIYMLNVHPATLMVYHVYIYLPRKKKKDLKNPPGSRLFAAEGGVSKRAWIDRQFDKYIYYMNNSHFAKFALLITVTYGVTMTYFAFQLETPTSVESNFGDDHMFTGFQDDFNGLFGGTNNDTLSDATAVFGIKGLDNEGVPRFSTDSFRGNPIYDENFEVFTEASQQFLLDYCAELRVRSCDVSEGVSAEGCTFKTLYNPTSISCWIEVYRLFHAADTESNGEFPFTTFISGDPTGTSEEEVFLDIKKFIQSVFIPGVNPLGGSRFARNVGVVDNVIKFTTFSFQQSMQEDQPLTVKQPVIGLMNDMTNEFRQFATDSDLPGMTSTFQTSFDYVWQHTEEALVAGLYEGMAISLAASFLVVLSGTRNFIVSVYAILGVGAIVMCVLGTIERFGFQLGTAEALAGVMVIGLAVDYTVHLGHMFVHSRKYLAEHDISDLAKENDKEHKSRIVQSLVDDENEVGKKNFEPRTDIYNEDMVHFAVDRMGVTILAGAVTTFCSGIFLLLCTLAFFTKMAILIVLTVIYSTLYAFLFFVPMLRLFGPGIKNKKRHQLIKQGAVEEGGIKKVTV